MRSALFRWPVLLLPVSLAACAFIDEEHEQWRLDPDGDGVGIEEDCDSESGAQGLPELWYIDLDGDGFGDPDNTVEACTRPDNGTTEANATDCWDNPDEIPDAFVALNGLPQPAAADVYPGADNALYDGVNQSCLPEADFTAAVDFDGDGDGYLTAAYADRSGSTGDDCIDGADGDAANPAGLDPEDVYPGATEVWYDGTDADCDSNDCDADGDGYDGGEGSDHCTPEDCDDTDGTISPDASVAEVFYNGIDDNCDLADADGDADGDGYWAADYTEQVKGAGAVPLPIPDGAEGDCWDSGTATEDETPINGFPALAAADVNPGATEQWYDAVDQDCSGGSDFDADNDGYNYADTNYPDRDGVVGDDCYDAADQPQAFVNLAGLAAANVNPGALELYYDGTDANCDGNDDDQDMDGDPAELAGGTDCDDTEPTVYGGAPQVCYDGIEDNDCDGVADEDCELSDMSLSAADVIISGVTSGGTFGVSVAVGDITGDGVPDMAVGASDEDAVYVFFGPFKSGSLSSSGADVILVGSGADSAGVSVSINDGDLLVGATSADYGVTYADSGAAYLLSGPLTASSSALSLSSAASVEFYVKEESSSLGTSVDLSDDGDLLLGAFRKDVTAGDDEGVAYVVTAGSTSGDVETAIELYGTTEGGKAGRFIEWVGDLNGDGDADAGISASGNTYTNRDDGEVFIVYGAASVSSMSLSGADETFYGATSADEAGVPGAAGDVDGDGYDDLIIGVFHDGSTVTSQTGAAYLFYGSSGGWSGDIELDSSNADATFTGDSDGDQFGYSVASAGDVDNDGDGDIIIGAYGVGSGSAEDGAAYVFTGPLTGSYATSDAVATLSAAASGDYAGFDVAAGADLDDDGWDDLVISSPYANSDDGAVSIIFGLDY